MSSTVSIEVFVSSYKPIPASVPGWDQSRQATWPATTSTLISAGQAAILVDALMTTTEGEQLAAWVKKSGKSLSRIFLTHGHADHFFGAGPTLRRFPQARLVALPEVVEEARGQVSPQYRQIWSSFFPGQYDENPAVPEPLPSPDLQLDGHTVRALAVGHADGPLATVLHIPELDAVICGDVAYNNIHMWLRGSTAESRGAWLAAMDAVAALKPMTIVTGHKDPDAPDDDATRVLDQSRGYIEDFNRAVEKSGSAEELIDSMLSRYPHFGNPDSLWLAAQSQFTE
jgi:glyoxylase-like metal-dependent hydrolase (beta-lactamase superfamily II)